MTKTRVELHIEELVLHGFPPGLDRERVGMALREELARLLAAQGVPPSLAREGELARRDGGSFTLAPTASPEAIGAQIARAIVRGTTR